MMNLSVRKSSRENGIHYFASFLFSFFFLDSSYWYLPKSQIRQTGGRAFGEISTRSNPARLARASALSVFMTPTCWPSASTTRTSRTRMRSLTRMRGSQRRPLPLPRGRLKAVPEVVEWPYLSADALCARHVRI